MFLKINSAWFIVTEQMFVTHLLLIMAHQILADLGGGDLVQISRNPPEICPKSTWFPEICQILAQILVVSLFASIWGLGS